jgi:hypothetical protein
MTPPPTFRLLFSAAMVLGAAQAGAACYTVHDAEGQIVHRADEAPASAAQAVTAPDGGRVPSTAPLLTHVHIAASARTPYAVVGRDIAVVAPASAEQVWQRAPVADRAVPVRASRPRPLETVITEWADGRVDVEQRPLPRRY